MTREEAKRMLPIIQAYAEGKEIQFKLEDKWINTKNPDIELGTGTYRIKPEPKYRPFKNAEECWNEMLKHQPFGWIKPENTFTNGFYSVTYLDYVCNEIYLQSSDIRMDLENASEWYTFADGTPFGIKEEE